MSNTLSGFCLLFFCLMIASSSTFMVGCSDDDVDTSDNTGNGGDAGGDASDVDDASCGRLQAGAWASTGACMGMEMSMTLTIETDVCTFTFSDWNMQMSTPAGGTISGQEVSFNGTDWDACTGTLSGDGTSVVSSCPESGGNAACDFEIHQVQ